MTTNEQYDRMISAYKAYEQIEVSLGVMQQAVYRIWDTASNEQDQEFLSRADEIYTAIGKLVRSKGRMKSETIIKRHVTIADQVEKLKADWVVRQKTKREAEIAEAMGAEKREIEINPPAPSPTAESEESKKETETKSLRGGARPGAGRKAKGVKKPVSINLSGVAWSEIDNLIQRGDYEGYADFFGRLYNEWANGRSILGS